MGTVGAVVAAQRARLVREFVNHLREQKSFSRETASLLRPQRAMGKRTLQALVADGAIVRVGEDLYWLDEASFAVSQKRRRGRVLWIVLALVVFAVATIVLAVKAGGQG